MNKIKALANDFVAVCESPSPDNVFCYSPGITTCPNGRLIATCDWGGPGMADINGVKTSRTGDANCGNQGKIFISDDAGQTWEYILDYPLMHSRPFVAGDSVYIIGHDGDIGILKSDDWGKTWSEISWLTDGQNWHQAPCNTWYANSKIYLVMERKTIRNRGWEVLAPVVMAGAVNSDLTKSENWTLSNELVFEDIQEKPATLGVPFFQPGPTVPGDPNDERWMAPVAWLESNIVQFNDPDNIWFDQDGRTFYLWMRAHTGSTNLACIAKACEDENGEILVSLAKSPSGVKMLYVPCPGGQMKFHIIYDEQSKLFWLLSTQATDSMTKPNKLGPERFNLPNNERQRLVLHFSKNCIDWCFAGLVAMGDSQKQSRHYASMCINGDDLCILSRSGNSNAKSSHNGNLITFHKISDFRQLIY